MREEQSLKPKKNITGPRRKARELAVQALYQYDFGHMDYDRLESLSWLAEILLLLKKLWLILKPIVDLFKILKS